MLGYQHFLGGAAAWLAVSPALAVTQHLTPGQIALGTVVAAGAGMAPDFDQPGSTVARTYGPVTNIAARVIALISGGHRNGTHSLLGLAAFTALAWFAVDGGWLRFLLLWILLGVACRAAGLVVPGHRIVTALLHAVSMGMATFLVIATGVHLDVVLPYGMALGAVSHIGLDMLTRERCPLLWPISKRRYGVDIFRTGSRWTGPLVTLALACAVLVLVALITPIGALVLA